MHCIRLEGSIEGICSCYLARAELEIYKIKKPEQSVPASFIDQCNINYPKELPVIL